MLTKVSYIATVAGVFGLLGIWNLWLFYKKKGKLFEGANIKKYLVFLTILIFGIIISAGWFYYDRNYRYSGSFFQATPQNYLSESRVYKSYKDVIFGKGLYDIVFSGFSNNVYLAFGVTLVSLMAVLHLIDLKKQSILIILKQNEKIFFIIFGFVLVFLCYLITQVFHAQGYGNFSFRYIIPAIAGLSFFYTFGLLQYGKTRPILIIALIYFSISSTVTYILSGPFLTTKSKIINLNPFQKLEFFLNQNNIPRGVSYLLIMILLFGVGLFIWNYRNMYKKETQKTNK